MKKILTIAFLVVLSSSVYAAGFRVALQSARQLGMGHVGVGMQLGAESIFFNPGALGLAEKGNISVSGNAVLANTQFNSPGSNYVAELEDNTGTPFAAYGSFRINEHLSAGLGVYTPFGSTVEWPDNWAGRGVSQLVDLSAIFIQPTLAFKMTDKVAFGVGFIYAMGDVTLKRGVPSITSSPEPDVTLETDKSASGIGFNMGLFVEPTENVSYGISYRTQVDMEAEDGLVTVDNVPSSAASLFQATRFNAKLPLPAELSFGISGNPTDRLTLAADMNYNFWSDYEQLKFDYDAVLGGSASTVVPQEWQDSWTTRIGVNYLASRKFNVRGGMYYDFSPIPDNTLSPITPDADRLGLTTGFTFNPNDRFAIDGSFLYINGKERTVQASENQFGFGQRYKITAMVPSFGINYSFN